MKKISDRMVLKEILKIKGKKTLEKKRIKKEILDFLLENLSDFTNKAIKRLLDKHNERLNAITSKRNWRTWLYVKKKRYRGEMNKLKGEKRVLNKMDPPPGSNRKAIDNEDRIINSINNNENNLPDSFWEKIELIPSETNAKKITHDNGFYIKNTSDWNDLKSGTMERSTKPKTDMQLSDNSKNINISIKSGKGRFTSADCYETSAIFKSVYNNKYQGNLEIKDIIDEILMLMKNLGKKTPIHKTRTVSSIKKEIKLNPEISDEDTEWVKKLEETEKKCNTLWLKLKNEHIEYVMDILFECVSGKYKFGDSAGCADWLLVTENSNSVNPKNIFKLDNRSPELDLYLVEGSKSPNVFKAKTGGTGKQMWIRFL
jgi:hypothetical protein